MMSYSLTMGPTPSHHVTTACPQGAYSPRWVVRFAKVTLLLSPVYVLLFLLLVLGAHRPVRRFETMRGESLEVFLQRTGQCNTMYPVPDNSSDSEGLRAFRICLKLNQAYTEYYKPRDAKVNPFNHTFVLPGSGICDSRTSVILLVHSLHDYYDRRKAIRETWGGAAKRNVWPRRVLRHEVKVAFVFGLHHNRTWEEWLRREARIYGDVIQGDFYEHYHNMTLKSLLGLKWVSEHCPQAKYFIKSDDDMIINLPLLLNVLDSRNMSRAIMGPLNKGSRVYRRTSKWSIPLEVFPFFYFPPYESGSTYVIGMDLVRPLFDLAEYVPPIFIDDVYITGILGQILKVRHLQQDGFAYWTNKSPTPCDVIEDVILTGTRMQPDRLYRIWSAIHRGTACPPSNQTIVVNL